MPRQRRETRPLRRQVGTRVPRKTIVAFCEGERTEPDYLNALKREPAVREAASVDIRVERGSDGAVPAALVESAVETLRRAREEEGEIDEVWCVFDVEWPKNHPNLAEVLRKAKEHGIKVAVSNPCFEVWLALHFCECSAWLDNNQAARLRGKYDKSRDKGVDGSCDMPHRAKAARRARALDKKHEHDGTTFPHDNPSSGMHRLLASVDPASAES